jgi:hypothetical protein
VIVKGINKMGQQGELTANQQVEITSAWNNK